MTQKEITLDLTLFDNHPEALAKITEAVARVYFDTVCTKKFDKRIAHAYGTLFNLCPNYRLHFLGKPGFEKYNVLNKEFGTITSLPLVQHQ